MLQIPTSVSGSRRDRGGYNFPSLRHILGFLPTVQAPAARGGVHSWKGITQLNIHGPAQPFERLGSHKNVRIIPKGKPTGFKRKKK